MIRKVLYLGLEKPENEKDKIFIHYPVIQIVPKPLNECKAALNQISSFTHIIFTSKTTVKIFFEYFSDSHFSKKIWIAVGKSTKKSLENQGILNVLTPKEETAEGIISLLKTLPLNNSHIFWPHSALSRPILRNFFSQEKISFKECILYDTIPFWPGYTPSFESIDEIIFTSPSTVDAFFNFFPNFAFHAKLNSIGPITKAKLENFA
ncbi:MAG TPA: uroporphyrinogen-III synthase [Parachlamydiaceae bacterium]|nr:uroporphyrinogen-III synthase [Parachlamydiaceae bacterium]